MLKKGVSYIILGMLSFTLQPVITEAKSECQLNGKKVKVEGYISKKFRKQRKKIIKEFIA